MTDKQPTYVLDTNVIVDYVDIIPGEDGILPVEPTIDLSEAHIVIPTIVVRELSSFKREKTDRGAAARIALRRLRTLVEGKICTMGEVYNLKAPVTTNVGSQKISILPVHQDFCKCLSFHPSDDDADGQIILTSLVTAFILNNLRIDGAELRGVINNTLLDAVTLITNDDGLAIRARERGIYTKRYGHKCPEPYTGRRDLEVPAELFQEFYSAKRLERTMFEELMPDEPKLVANEFIVMRIEEPGKYPRGYDPMNDPYFLYIGRYDKAEDAILSLKYVVDFPGHIETAGQAIYAEALLDPRFAAVVCTGPAGSGKTYMATVYGYNACKNGNFIGVTAVPCENNSKIGALPGDLQEKMDPDLQPLKNALQNYLIKEDPKFRRELEIMRKFGSNKKCKKDCNTEPDDDTVNENSIKTRLEDRVNLIWKKWFSCVPVEKARGRDFANVLAIYDEFQDQNISQADTLIKRIGMNGKIILTGDIYQIHAPYLDESNNGLVYAARLLYDIPMVAQVRLTEEEVERHQLVQEITKRQKRIKKS